MGTRRIFSDSPIRDLWNQISLLCSEDNARNFLEAKVSKKAPIDEKAKGISFCIESAREYFQAAPEHNLTTSSLLYYYGTFSLFSALLLANISNSITLAEIEKSSKFGHGLGIIDAPGCPALLAPHLFLLNRGFLFDFLNLNKIDVSHLLFESKPKKWGHVVKDGENKLISFVGLVKRIPELQPLYDEIFGDWPHYLNYRLINYQDGPGEHKTTFEASFSDNSKYLCEEMIGHILPSLKGAKFIREPDPTSEQLVVSSLSPTQIRKNEKIPWYKSVLCPDVKIKPLKETIENPLIYHFMLLYFLSILVRYRPNVWRNVISGLTEEYRPLIAKYLRVVERIVPNLFVDQLYNERFLFAPHSYLG